MSRTAPSTSATVDTPDLPTYLRDSTAAAHLEAESRPLHRALARGTISAGAWITNLEQLLLIHRALEAAVERKLRDDPSWSALAGPERRRVPDLLADLSYFGGNTTPTPLPATAGAMNAIGAAGELEIVGMLYVTEGSTNGGRMLVKSLARALGLGPAAGRLGFRALDPYGEAQPARWAAFKATLAAAPGDPVLFERIRAGALAMFAMISTIADDVWEAAARDLP